MADTITVRDMVATLNAELGTTMVAALTGSAYSKVSEGWERGEEMDPRAERRIRTAHAAWTALVKKEGADVARVWFRGSNPFLNDRSPVLALRSGYFDEFEAAVAAMRSDAWAL